MKRLLSSLLILVMLFALFTADLPCEITAAGTQPSTYSDQYNSGTRDVTCTTLNGTDASTYYTGSNTYDSLSGQSASSLLQALRSLMTSTHKRISSYSNCRDYANRTDCQNGDSSTIVTIYTSYVSSHSEYQNGQGWNREHVWPKSLGGNNTSGGGADLHHIRPSESIPNSTRGNKLYGNAPSGKNVTGNLSGYPAGKYSTYYEPLDNVKGDVARICLYVYVRWGSSWGADSITEVFQSVDVLLQWMELDPVDTWEMGRNEVVQSIQGNRNVFIDYPEYAWLLFGREVPKNMTTPSGEAKNSTGGSTTPTPCQHTSTEVRGWKGATCTATGYTGDTYCKSCGVKIATGSTTPVAAHKDNNGDGKCDSCGTRLVACEHRTEELRSDMAATCTTAGYTGDTYCLDCGELISAGQDIPAPGHKDLDGNGECDSCGTRLVACEHRTEELRSDMAATCTTAGYTGDTYCLDCGELISAGQDIPAPGHKDLDGNGECDSCGNRATCEHTHVEIRNRVAASCTQAGYTGDRYCTDCQTVIGLGNTIPEVHVDGDRNYTCDACGATIEPPATEPTTPPTQATVPPTTSGNAPTESNDILPIILIIAGVAVVVTVAVVVIIVIKKKKAK